MTFIKHRFIAFAIGTLVTITACNAQEASAAKSEGRSGAAATVNGVAIPQSRVDLLMKERAARGQPDTPEIRKALVNELIQRELVSQEAQRKGIEKNPDVATQLDLARQEIMLRAYIADYLKSTPITDDMIKNEYEKLKAQMGDKEYRARHILVESEADAKNIIAQLKKGVKFEKLAAEKSKDPGSKGNGGELGWITPPAVPKPFADALTKLKKGQFTTEPVQTPAGWHIIKLEEIRPLPGLDAVKEQVRQRLQQQQVERLLTDLRSKAKIEDYTPAPAAAKSPAAPAAPANK